MNKKKGKMEEKTEVKLEKGKEQANLCSDKKQETAEE
jgi:hypothetical protein